MQARLAGIPKAASNGAVLAEAQTELVELVEGNVYFPPKGVDKWFLCEAATRTVCPLKGTASYYDVAVHGDVNKNAAWYYSVTKPAASIIAGHVAFWKGVLVEE